MKLVLLALFTPTLLALAACQSDMTGTPRTMEATPSSTNLHPDVQHGDAHFEEMLDRYDLPSDK